MAGRCRRSRAPRSCGTAVAQLVGTDGADAPEITYTLGADPLGVAPDGLGAPATRSTPALPRPARTASAACRARPPTRSAWSSETTLAVDVARATAQTTTADATRTTSTATVSARPLATRTFQLGVGEANTNAGAATGRPRRPVVTDYDPSDGDRRAHRPRARARRTGKAAVHDAALRRRHRGQLPGRRHRLRRGLRHRAAGPRGHGGQVRRRGPRRPGAVARSPPATGRLPATPAAAHPSRRR